MKHLFIVNPAAGGRDRTAEIEAEAEKILSGRDEPFEVYTTKAPMDAPEKIAREAEETDALRVYACGGDGTLNECACGAVGRGNVALTSYPAGTGNDFIKIFGGGAERFRDLPALCAGEVYPLDAVDCNGRCCINICSVGIDARVGVDVHKYSRIPLIGGATGYVTSLAVNFFKGITDRLRVKCGDGRFEGDMNLICCCNGGYYGGGFHPVPEARPDDGVLDFLIVKGVSRLAILRVIGGYAKGRYADYPKLITHLRGGDMEIESERELVVNVDGEAMYTKRLHLRLLPAALNFIAPKGLTYFAERAKKTAAFV